ncbi:formyl transferase [Morchella snyderi]|nr:formyl transferase [Morchella snyderi]
MSFLRQSALALLARPSPCSHRPIAPLCRVSRRLFSSRATANVPRPPLQILFCGSDHFSATSLKALYALHQERRDIIASIDVLCREDKLSGRGRRTLKQVPIKEVASSLGLCIHEIDRFKDWELPKASSSGDINLLVAASFGLLIPERIIDAVKYGGINVHPSLLPMYRGAAPIFHTLLNSTPITGVTVQTLHPKRIDAGEILIQTDPPLSVPPKTKYQDLHDALAVHGAELLVETCIKGLFIPPIKPITNDYTPSLAPKLKAEIDSRIKFSAASAEEVERKAGALKSLWCRFGSPEEPQILRRKRVILSDVHSLDVPEEDIDGVEAPPGTFQYLRIEGEGEGEDRHGEELLAIKCKVGGGWVRVGGIKLEGKKLVDGGEWARSMKDPKKRGLQMFI